MKTSTKVIIAILLVLVIAAVAIADAMKEESLTGQLKLWLAGDGSSSSIASSEGTPIDAGQSSSDAQVVDNTRVTDAIAKNNLEAQEKEEASILRQLLPTQKLGSFTLLQENDRAGSLTYVEGGDTKKIYQALKESLLQSFSSGLQDLQDRTIAEPGKPVYSVLTFLDPALSSERLTFVKTQNAVYELHAVQGKEAFTQPLIQSLLEDTAK